MPHTATAGTGTFSATMGTAGTAAMEGATTEAAATTSCLEGATAREAGGSSVLPHLLG